MGISNYKEVRTIGRGGFGKVSICRRVSDKEEVAKKELTDSTPDAVARFKREVRLLSSLDHPNVVKVLDHSLQEEPYFYIMPLYEESLDSKLSDLASDPKQVEIIFSKILDGISYAHDQGVIHRDLKPLNILINSNGDIAVSDFGLGRQLDTESTRKTTTGIGMGTELYMAPEQFKDAKSADMRSDVFALGRILTEMYTGFLSPGAQNLDVAPPRVRAIIRRATHYDPESRFETAKEFKKAWQDATKVSEVVEERAALGKLTSKFLENPNLPEEDIYRLVELLYECLGDTDALHKAIMTLPVPVIGRAFEANEDVMSTVLEAFGDFVAKQSWAFEYTDTIARQCAGIFENIDLPIARAKIVASIAELGLRHNRWFVMGRASVMIEMVENQEEETVFVEELVEAGPEILEALAQYVTFEKLAPRLQELLYIPESSD